MSCSDNGPDITIVSPENGASYSPGDIINLNVMVTDDVSVATIGVSSSGLGLNTSDPITGELASVNYTLDITLDAATPADEYELTITATDGDGNFSDEKLTISVE